MYVKNKNMFLIQILELCKTLLKYDLKVGFILKS